MSRFRPRLQRPGITRSSRAPNLPCSVSGRFWVRFQPVLHDLPVERAAADVEHRAPPASCSSAPLSSTRTMCARSASASDGSRSRGGVGRRLARRAGTRCRPARMTRPGDESAARDTVLSSSRMLPGQWYCISRSIASFEKLLPSSGRPLRRAVAREEALREHRDVAGALAQRRQPDRERVDAVVEILAEARVADELIERPVGRRDQPEVRPRSTCCRRAARSGAPRARAAAWPAR